MEEKTVERKTTTVSQPAEKQGSTNINIDGRTGATNIQTNEPVVEEPVVEETTTTRRTTIR